MAFKALLATKRGEKITTALVELEEKDLMSSVITLKPAIRYHFKTGQRKWPKT